MQTNKIKEKNITLGKTDSNVEEDALNGGKVVAIKEPIDRSQLRIKESVSRNPYIEYFYVANSTTTTQTITHDLGVEPSMVKVDISVFGPTERGTCNGTWTENEGQMCVGLSEGYGGNASTTDIGLFSWSAWDWTLNLDNVTTTSIDLTPSNSGTLLGSTGFGVIVTVYP